VGSTNLFDDHINFVAVLHIEVLGGLVLVESLSVEKESDVVGFELGEGRVTDWRWQ